MGFISDGVNSFFSSANAKITGIVTGTNPLTSPVAGELLGFNVPGVPIISSRDYFLQNMESWVSAIPMRTQWVVLIESFPVALNTQILRGLENTPGDPKAWDIDRAVSLMTSFPNQKINGCMFAQGVSIPNEAYNIDSASVPNNRGFVPGVISSDRQSYAGKPLTIEFRETNVSFTDFVIRPWTILSSHYGYVARGPEEQFKNIRSNIMILQFAKTFQGMSMIPRKVWRFYNCAPYSVASQELTYDAEEVEILDTQWAYTHYTVENNMYLPIPDIIDKIRDFNFKSASDIFFPSL